jgi:hypothetical protein
VHEYVAPFTAKHVLTSTILKRSINTQTLQISVVL